MSSFGIYIIGFLILIVGLGLAAWLLGAPTVWIAVGVIVLLGMAVISGVGRTRTRDVPDEPRQPPPGTQPPPTD